MIFHYITRAIIIADGKVLLARQKGATHTFLPGGHIERGEKAKDTLEREIEEELGRKARVKRFVGAVESTWTENNEDNHEINLVFEVSVPDIDATMAHLSHEAHLDFIWAEVSELSLHNLQPYPLVDCIMNGEAAYEGFWGSAID